MAFAAVPIVYFTLEWLNWDVGGRVTLLGVLAVLSASAWTARSGRETKTGKVVVIGVAGIFFAAFAFHAFLNEFFGVQPDDAHVIAAMFSSDQAEAAEFLLHQARPIAKHTIIILLALAAFAFLVWIRPPLRQQEQGVTALPERPRWKLATFLTSLFLLLHLGPTLRNQNPVLYIPVRYSEWKEQVETVRQLQAVMATASKDPGLASIECKDDQPRTVVFVLGESLTRLNLPISGYQRNTTPLLTAMGDELTWFTDVLSSDPSTSPSLEKMLTPANIKEPLLWLTKPDILVMAKKAGYKTFWLSNHSTDANGHISIFASHADETLILNKGGSRGEGFHDEVVLPRLESALRDPARRKFIILHLLNAHPAYYFRYPERFAKFNDADDEVTRQMKAAGRRFWAIRMRNYYDNAILYTDYVLKRSIDLCRESGQRVAWIFVPDHGQDAAHNSNFSGHNARARSQYETFMVFWRSSGFPAPTVPGPVLQKRPYQTDHLEHTLLGLLGISGLYYDPRGDIFSEQFQSSERLVRGNP